MAIGAAIARFRPAIQRGRGLFNLWLDQRRLQGDVQAFAHRHGPAVVDKVVRKTAFDIASLTVRSLNGAEAGYPNPKRIDTGRYRAAWVVAAQKATGQRAGSTAVAPFSRDGLPNPPKANDGVATKSGSGLDLAMRVTNNVEYGPDIEFGTDRMMPGQHLGVALVEARRQIRGLLGKELGRAWHL